MSAFTSACPGRIPAHGGGAEISPKDLFSSESALGKFGLRQPGSTNMMAEAIQGRAEVSGVKVEIFDLSDEKQRNDYEKLWMKLFPMAVAGDAYVDTRKDLVHRADGTSYWMKYVEYVTFSHQGKKKDGKAV